MNAGSHSPPGSGSSTSTATAAPAATQRSCWRSTPREARNRNTTQTSAASKPTAYNTRPLMVTTTATLPATPATAAAAASRQRRDRSRPSGNSRNGRVRPCRCPW
jgi:hypothetical protein